MKLASFNLIGAVFLLLGRGARSRPSYIFTPIPEETVKAYRKAFREMEEQPALRSIGDTCGERDPPPSCSLLRLIIPGIRPQRWKMALRSLRGRPA